MIARVGLDRSASFFASRRVLASFQFPTIEKGKNVDVKEPQQMGDWLRACPCLLNVRVRETRTLDLSGRLPCRWLRGPWQHQGRQIGRILPGHPITGQWRCD